MKTIIRYEGKEYIEANNTQPIMSNDPCSCGSGKKFKKCCGA